MGLAAAEKHLAARFNKDDMKIVDHYTYAPEHASTVLQASAIYIESYQPVFSSFLPDCCIVGLSDVFDAHSPFNKVMSSYAVFLSPLQCLHFSDI